MSRLSFQDYINYQGNGRVNFTVYPMILGPYTIQYSSQSTECDYSRIMALAMEQAGKDYTFADTTGSQSQMFIIPGGTLSSCEWNGYAGIGYNWALSRCLSNQPERLAVYAHEYGHNLGFMHSVDSCGKITPADSPMMGYSPIKYVSYSAPQLVRLGWVDALRIYQGVRFKLSPLDLPSSRVNSYQAATIGGSSFSWTLSFRRSVIGMDPIDASYQNTLSIHKQGQQYSSIGYVSLEKRLNVGETYRNVVDIPAYKIIVESYQIEANSTYPYLVIVVLKNGVIEGDPKLNPIVNMNYQDKGLLCSNSAPASVFSIFLIIMLSIISVCF